MSVRLLPNIELNKRVVDYTNIKLQSSTAGATKINTTRVKDILVQIDNSKWAVQQLKESWSDSKVCVREFFHDAVNKLMEDRAIFHRLDGRDEDRNTVNILSFTANKLCMQRLFTTTHDMRLLATFVLRVIEPSVSGITTDSRTDGAMSLDLKSSLVSLIVTLSSSIETYL